MASPGNNASQEQLVQHVEKIEALLDQKQDIADEISDVYRLAKSDGYDNRTIRAVIQLRKLTREQRIERRSLLDTYLAAFGLDDEE